MGGDTQVGANEGLEEITQSKKIKALVIEDVKVLTRELVVDKPRYRDVEQIKYNTKEEAQTKFITEEQSTTKFIPQEESTIKYIPKEEETIKYRLVEKEYEVERPVPVDKRYERPVIIDKEYQIATYKDVDALKSLLELIPKVMKEMDDMRATISKLKDVKLVEEIKRVPEIKYIPTEVERVVYKDVSKERCEKCSKEV